MSLPVYFQHGNKCFLHVSKFNIDFVQDNSSYIECMYRYNCTKNSIIKCALTCTGLINIRDNNMICPLTSGQCDKILQILCTDPDIIFKIY